MSKSFHEVYWLIKQHNELCLMLKRFNDFWKHLLVLVVSVYIIAIWFIVYGSTFYLKMDLIAKLLMCFVMVEVIGIFASIVIIIFSISAEVINIL